MSTREKFYAVKDALDDNNQILLTDEARLENTAYEVSNLPKVKAALDAWQSFSWSETPGGSLKTSRTWRPCRQSRQTTTTA